MKRFLLLLFIITGFQQTILAQGDGSGRVRNMRIEYVKERLHLTPEQAKHFWPIYVRFLEERSALRHTYVDQFKSQAQNQQMSNYQAHRYVDENIEYKEKDLQLTKKYKDRFLEVITPEQLATLYQTEREFKQMLIEKLKDK